MELSGVAPAGFGEDGAAMDIATQPKLELIQVADVVARDKGIDREEVLIAMEQAIQKAGRSKYGPDHDIRPTIDRRTGEISLKRCTTVVEEIEGLMGVEGRASFGAMPDRPFEQIRRANTEATFQALGWRPRTGLSEGLERTIEWYRGHPRQNKDSTR